MSNFHARNDERRRRDAHTWLVTLVVFAVLLAIFVLAPAPAGAAGYDAEQNHPSYWGDDCVKTEQALQGPRWYTPVNEGYRLVVLKSGTTNDVFRNVPADTPVSTVSGKDISHVIYCGPTAPPTTTTEAPTTTVPAPPSTTVPVPGTTTVPEVPCEEDDPCWECETMGNRICGPIPVMPPPVPIVTTPRFTG